MIKSQFLYSFVLATLLFHCNSCASFGTPTGGPVDEDPPVIDTTLSEKNEQINFTKKSFELHFDEFISLKNVSKQLIVSPPLSYKPIVESRSKKIKFSFHEDEELKKDATYVINFGESISDFRANNVLENFTFVFATGDKLDSLKTTGTIHNAIDKKPLKNIIVALYDTFQDSVIVNDRPFYLAKTDKEGKFEINNVKSDTFKIVAFDDLNLNLKYDSQSEKIGFIDSLIHFTDSSDLDFKIDISMSESNPRFLKNKTNERGVYKLLFDSSPEGLIYNTDPTEIVDFDEANGDTLILYSKQELDSFVINMPSDTLKIYEDTAYSYPKRLFITSLNSRKGMSRFDSLELVSNIPIQNIVDSLFLINDSLNVDKTSISFSENTLSFKPTKARVDSTYKLTLYPGAVVDIFNNTIDTSSYSFRILSDESFGNINISIDSLRDTIQYLISLESKKDKLLEHVHYGSSSFVLSKSHLPPGKYFINILEDRDRNGRWTPADYWKKSQAELNRVFNLEELRANWDLEDQIFWNESLEKK